MAEFLLTTQRLGLHLLDKLETVGLLSLKNELVSPLSALYLTHHFWDELTEARLNYSLLHYANQGLPAFGIYELATGQLIGHAGFSLLPNGEIEIGYMLDKSHWGFGYAGEALEALLNWSKIHISARYIIAYMPAQHKSSLRVLQKCGMQHYKDESVQGVICSFYRIRNN